MSKKKEVARIHFMDGSVRSFGIDEEITSLQLKEIISDKLELKDNQTFGIFEKKSNFQRPVRNEEKILAIIQSWTEDETNALTTVSSNNENRNSTRPEAPIFVFRKSVFFRNETFNDPTARNLTYIQLLYYIVESIYPCSIEDSIKLAGIQFQAIYGDHKADTHQAGFIEDKIKEYIPRNLLQKKKNKEWESLILQAHQKYKGQDTSTAEATYINYVRQITFYGTEFFLCKNTQTKKLPDKVILGVNEEGLVLLKKDNELIFTCPWTDLTSWNGANAKQISFDIVNRDQVSKYILDYPDPKLISQLITYYVDYALNQTFKTLFNPKSNKN